MGNTNGPIGRYLKMNFAKSLVSCIGYVRPEKGIITSPSLGKYRSDESLENYVEYVLNLVRDHLLIPFTEPWALRWALRILWRLGLGRRTFFAFADSDNNLPQVVARDIRVIVFLVICE